MATARRLLSRIVLLDRSLELLPLFRLSDSAEDGAVDYTAAGDGRWRVLPAPGERLPGTFDQDVYVEILRRYHEAGAPADGAVSFTLHAFLRSMGRRVDGRTYEQLRSALTRLHRTTLESSGAYHDATANVGLQAQFTVLSSVQIDRRRLTDREQLALFSTLTNNEPGDARVVIGSVLRSNISAGYTTTLSAPRYFALNSPVARRVYRLLEAIRAAQGGEWLVDLDQLANQVPLIQRFPSHLQRVLQPAHEMLLAAGLLREAVFIQEGRAWRVRYVLGPKAT